MAVSGIYLQSLWLHPLESPSTESYDCNIDKAKTEAFKKLHTIGSESVYMPLD